MESSKDAATICIHHEHLGQWHGPLPPDININELADFVKKIIEQKSVVTKFYLIHKTFENFKTNKIKNL